MQNFEWNLPTRFLFGKGMRSRVGQQCAAYGRKALVIYGGKSAEASGLLGDIQRQLSEAGISFLTYGGIKPNPKVGPVRECIQQCREQGVDLILAVGGGSVMDTAKAAAAGIYYEGDPWDLVTGAATVSEALPVGAVVTIPASGSESSDTAVISDDSGANKGCVSSPLLIPRFAILDPTLTYTLPAYQTACGAADMMAHVMERYFTNEPNVLLTDMLCEAILRAVIHSAPLAIAQPDNYAARAELMWAGCIAHNDTCGVGRIEDWASHSIEHELSARYDVAHGAGLAVVFPAWMKYVYRHDIPRFARFAKEVWGIAAPDQEQAALKGIEAMESFFESLGLPIRLEQLGALEADIPYMAEHTFKWDGKTTGSFVPLTTDDIEALLRLAL